jgi:predicted membrane metal-binding protein
MTAVLWLLLLWPQPTTLVQFPPRYRVWVRYELFPFPAEYRAFDL